MTSSSGCLLGDHADMLNLRFVADGFVNAAPNTFFALFYPIQIVLITEKHAELKMNLHLLVKALCICIYMTNDTLKVFFLQRRNMLEPRPYSLSAFHGPYRTALQNELQIGTSTVYWCIASKLKAPRNFYWMTNMFLWVEIFLFFVCYHVVPKRHSQLDYELNGL